MAARHIWYELVNQHRTKLGSADRVEVSSDEADLVEFLDAVKKRNADGLMKGIGVISAEVYASSGTTIPLRKGTKVASLGKTDAEALVVVVPSPSGRSGQLAAGNLSFLVRGNMVMNPPALVAFWTVLAANSTALQYGKVIELPPETYLLGDSTIGSRIFVRKCYKDLWDVCMERVHGKYPHLVIVGNPGIGKTFFGYVLLLELARSGKTVVYQNTEDERILFSPDVVVRGSGDDFKQLLREPDTYYIVDGFRPRSYNCKTILLTSPNREVWSRFYKKNCAKVYMPVWSSEEIFKCHPLMFSEVPVDTVSDRLRRYGGIPSHVLRDDLAERHELVLQRALDRVTLDAMMHAFGNTENSDFEITLALLHFRVSKRFVRVYFVFASRYVQEEVYKRLYKHDKRKLLAFMSQRDQFASYSVLRGFLFEEYVHSVLAHGGRFEIRRLLPNDEGQAVAKTKPFVGFGGDNGGYWSDEDSDEGEEDEDDDDGDSACAESMEVDIPHAAVETGNNDTSVTLPTRQAVAFDGDAELAAADNNVYLRPLARSYKSVDAIVKPGVLFQVTGAPKRPCTQSRLHSVLSHLGDPESPRLYFVLPPVRFDGFQYQAGLDNMVEQADHANARKIEQFALKVELPLE